MSTEQGFSSQYKTLFDPSTCARRGLCPITQTRKQGDPLESHSLYFEQHGNGPEKIIFIMGLNTSTFVWGHQIYHFGHSEKYTALAFDNRGVGHSGTPRGPYTTSGMAEDTIALLNYVGWTDKSSIHIVGLSMGGMIAQEIATRIPERIVSLSLVVTKAGGSIWSNLFSMNNIFRALFSLDSGSTARTENQGTGLLDFMYPQEWLDSKSPDGRTNREVQLEATKTCVSIIPVQPIVGSLSQLSALATHYCSNKRLRYISSTIPKVAVVGGDEDVLIPPHHSVYLKGQMPEAELIVFEKTGHAICSQNPARFNETLLRIFTEGRERVAV